MTGLLVSEWIKLRTVRSHLVLAIVALGFPLLVSGLTMLLGDDLSDDALTATTVGAGVLSGLLVGVVGVLAFAQEINYGTLRVTFAATPVRGKVIAAKVVVIALFGALMALVITGVCTVAGQLIASNRDIDVTLVAASYVAFLVLTVLLAVLGLGLGMLVRNTPVAIVILIAWPLIGEALVGGLLTLVVDDAFKYMPVSGAINSISTDTVSDSFGRVGGLVYLGVWVVVVAGLGALVNSRRDA